MGYSAHTLRARRMCHSQPRQRAFELPLEFLGAETKSHNRSNCKKGGADLFV